jgi:hypothetical protein
VAAADDDDVKFLGVVHPPILIYFPLLVMFLAYYRVCWDVNAVAKRLSPVTKLAYLVQYFAVKFIRLKACSLALK